MGMLDRQLTVEQAVEAANIKRKATGEAPISTNQVAVLKKMGFTNGEQVSYFNAEIEANPKLKDMFAGFEKDFAGTKKYDDVLKKIGTQVLADGAKIKFDPDDAKKSGTGIIDKLAKDLSGTNGPQMIKQLRERPDIIAGKLDGYASGTVSIAALVAQPVVTTPAPEVAPASPTSTGKKAAVKTPTPVTTAPPVTAPVATPAAATPPAQAANASASGAPAQDPVDKVLTALAGASDSEIKSDLTKSDVKLILNGMSDQAASKFGVEAGIAQDFKTRLEKDPDLLDQITTNFQNNPEFVRQLAKAGKDKTPLSKEMKDMAKGTMTKVMENPEDLAKDAYVKDLSRKMDAADKFGSGGFGKILGNLFGEGFGAKISAFFGELMEKVKNFFSGFMGKPVLSLSTSGNSLLPNVLIHTQNFAQNQDRAAAFSRYKPEDMTALPITGADGKIFHDVVIGKNDKGEDIKRQEPNTITLKTADGKDVKVIPSVGKLMAQQIAGQFDPAGKFMPGNVLVPIVQAIDKNGNSTKIAMIEMTPAAFDKYKTDVEAEAAKRGKSSTLQFEAYTAQDAIKAGKPPGLQIISVNAKTGAVSEPVEVPMPTPIARPMEPTIPSNVGVVDKRNLPANDPAYSLQA